MTHPNLSRLGQHFGEVYEPREEDADRRSTTHEQLNALLWVFTVRNMRRRNATTHSPSQPHAAGDAVSG